MRQHFLYETIDNLLYDSEKLPKGHMCALAMNPHNGNVFLQLDKHALSSVLALEHMRTIVGLCDELEELGVSDPLRELAELGESGELRESGFKTALPTTRAQFVALCREYKDRERDGREVLV